MSDFKPKILAFCCNWWAYAAADLAGVSRFQYPPDIRLIRLMCLGRLDPPFILEAFENGADGVFTGGWKFGECHYSTGNFQAESKVILLRKILETIGLNPQRLAFEQMSAAEGGKFVELVTKFSQTIKELGPLKKEMDSQKLKIKLQAAKKAVEGKKLRWVVAKRVEFMTDGNLYGEVFTEQEINRLFEEVVLDELAIQDILLLTRERPISVGKLSEKTNLAPSAVLRRLTDMKRMGLMQVEKIDGRTPLWKAVEEGEKGDESSE